MMATRGRPKKHEQAMKKTSVALPAELIALLEVDAKRARLRTAIHESLKSEAEAIALQDVRIRSLSQLVEAAVGYYLQQYKANHGRLDGRNFPLPTEAPTRE